MPQTSGIRAPRIQIGVGYTREFQTTPQTSGIRAPGATLEKLSGDLQFAEGPTCDPTGNVFSPTSRTTES
jgi:hypothetical protein